MADYSFNPARDPARRGKASYTAGGNPGYPDQVAAYNQWLYTPMDRRPTPAGSQPSAPDPNLSQYTAPGWHAPSSTDAASIANRYSPEGIAASGISGGMATTMGGSAGPSGATGVTGASSAQPSILDTAPKATMSGPTPPQNAMQRWTAQASQPQQPGIKPLSDQRRYFWATGSIDARATPSPRNSSPAPVTFNNSPSNWVAW